MIQIFSQFWLEKNGIYKEKAWLIHYIEDLRLEEYGGADQRIH